MSNGLDPDQDRRVVGPYLDPNCLQRLSAVDKSPLARKYLIEKLTCDSSFQVSKNVNFEAHFFLNEK